VTSNRPISTFVATFAILSLAASALPLVTHGGGQSLVPALERGATFTVYCVFLLVSVFFILPAAFRKDEGRGLVPWAPLAAFALLFAAVPGVVSAYISGVARDPALFLAGLIAFACAVVVLLRAAFGRFAVVLSFALGCLLLFVAPAAEAFAWSTGTRLAFPLSDVSPIAWVRRVALERQPVDPRAMIIAAGAAWTLVVLAAAVRGRRGAAVALSALAILPVAFEAPAAPEITVRPLLAATVRAGARVPFAIALKGATGEATIAFRSESVRVPADGSTSTVLLVLAPGESECEASVGGQKIRVPLPVRFTDAAKALVGAAGAASLAESVATVLPAAEVVPIDLFAAPPVPGALEAFDAIVIGEVDWNALPTERRTQLRDYGALGGSLRVVATPWSLKSEDLRRPLGPNAFDPTLTGLFARPDWQALDLSKLLLFLIAYHGAFFLAFLLPLGLDSHKSTAVYLVSVGTVMVVVVLASWWSLKQFFLRDNQVYTQALTFVSAPAEDGKAVVRQFRCYASMSGESRDFPWDPTRDLVAYRDPSAQGRVLATSPSRRLDDVWLDRFQSKLLVREDLVVDAPLELVADGAGFRVDRTAKGSDPLGLRTCTLTAAAVIGEDGSIRAATVDGNRIMPRDKPDQGGDVPGFDGFARALLGRFRKGAHAGGRQLVVVRAAGVRRLDDVTGFFHVADLQAVLAFER
jgi:hypothetical protein